MKPILKIGDNDYTDLIETMEPERNDLDADGSGRDIQTGQMHRTKVASKLKFQVKMLRLSETVMAALASDLMSSTYYSAKVLNPYSNAQESHSFYTSTIPFGTQRYNRKSGKTFYDGVSFDMIER